LRRRIEEPEEARGDVRRAIGRRHVGATLIRQGFAHDALSLFDRRRRKRDGVFRAR
jgi:hypothetical protein